MSHQNIIQRIRNVENMLGIDNNSGSEGDNTGPTLIDQIKEELDKLKNDLLSTNNISKETIVSLSNSNDPNNVIRLINTLFIEDRIFAINIKSSWRYDDNFIGSQYEKYYETKVGIDFNDDVLLLCSPRSEYNSTSYDRLRIHDHYEYKLENGGNQRRLSLVIDNYNDSNIEGIKMNLSNTIGNSNIKFGKNEIAQLSFKESIKSKILVNLYTSNWTNNEKTIKFIYLGDNIEEFKSRPIKIYHRGDGSGIESNYKFIFKTSKNLNNNIQIFKNENIPSSKFKDFSTNWGFPKST